MALIYDKNSASGQRVGPDTYLHAGAGKGWPANHKAEDTFEFPKALPLGTFAAEVAPEYKAVFGGDGSAKLIFTHTHIIATFDTFADAQLAAEALNNHKGY